MSILIRAILVLRRNPQTQNMFSVFCEVFSFRCTLSRCSVNVLKFFWLSFYLGHLLYYFCNASWHVLMACWLCTRRHCLAWSKRRLLWIRSLSSFCCFKVRTHVTDGEERWMKNRRHLWTGEKVYSEYLLIASHFKTKYSPEFVKERKSLNRNT